MEGNLLISAVRLTRPKNLIIIIATMIGVGYCILSHYPLTPFNTFDFSFLLMSTVLIAGAGNMINDYFDVEADKINKPQKLIITKHMQKKQVIWIYIIFNLLGLGIGLYLSSKYHTLWYVIVNITCILVLWLYSSYIKKTLFLSNLLIALLTGFIPILALSFFMFSKDTVAISDFNDLKPKLNLIYVLAFFAILQNLAREICKDLVDISGDEKIKVLSIPIKYGSMKTRYFVGLILITEMLCLLIGNLVYGLELETSAYIAITIALILNLCILIILSDERRFTSYSQRILKLSMVIGLSALYF